MIDLPLLEQIDRLLFAALVGLVAVPLGYAVMRLGRRQGTLRTMLEVALLFILAVVAAAALFVGTLGSLRAYVFVGLLVGTAGSALLLGLLGVPWKESTRRRRT